EIGARNTCPEGPTWLRTPTRFRGSPRGALRAESMPLTPRCSSGGPPPRGAVSEGVCENGELAFNNCDRTTSEGPAFTDAAWPERGDEGGGPLRLPYLLRQRQTALAHLLRCEPVDRRRLDAEHGELEIQLAAVMNLVLDHQAQPLSDRDRRAAGRFALAMQIGIGQPPEDLHRLRMPVFQILSDCRHPARELRSVPGITRGFALHVLAVHPALDAR